MIEQEGSHPQNTRVLIYKGTQSWKKEEINIYILTKYFCKTPKYQAKTKGTKMREAIQNNNNTDFLDGNFVAKGWGLIWKVHIKTANLASTSEKSAPMHQSKCVYF